MTVAEIRFRFQNKDGIDKWISNYIEYLENIILKIDKDFYEIYLSVTKEVLINNNDYIQFLENKIVELTRN